MGQAQVEKIIDEQTQGRIFGVTFEKKDGSLRQMVCRKGVRVGVKGTGAGWGAGSLKPLRTVFDMKEYNTQILIQKSYRKLCQREPNAIYCHTNDKKEETSPSLLWSTTWCICC